MRILLTVLMLSLPALAAGDWREKVSPRVLAEPGAVEFLLVLRETADTAPAYRLRSKEEKGWFVYRALTRTAARAQLPVLDDLRKRGLQHRPFWIVNMIRVRGTSLDIERLAQRPDVDRVVSITALRLPEVEPAATSAKPSVPGTIEWNIGLVNAPQVWAQGITGAGVTVGGIDSGYDWTHPTLLDQYRGWDGVAADHAYNWHDAIHSGGTNCLPDSPEPCDEGIHGTHTMGIMVGDDGSGNQIGMAPGARWVGCRCWEPVLRTDVGYLAECLQWMLAPTDADGNNPDPARAPHVVNNSWVCEPVEGCEDVNVLLPAFTALRAAGVMQVGGAGNDGPNCSSSVYPPTIYGNYFSVAATTNTDVVATFSSRGPITVDGSGRRKPDISAPGQDVRSCVPGGGFLVWSGTSFAGPHVAGLVALLIEANPALAGNVDALEQIITQTAVPKTDAQTCGSIPGSEVPNNTYGFGRIDAWAAYQMAVSLSTPVPEPPAPDRVALSPIRPNPVRTTASLEFTLPEPSWVELAVFDVAGRRVRALERGERGPGVHGVVWDGTDSRGIPVGDGLYFVRLVTAERSVTRRLVVLR